MMGRCKIAIKLAKKVEIESGIAELTGYTDDFVDAYVEYVQHISDHGCWRYEP